MRLAGLLFASMLALAVPAQAATVCGNSVVEAGEDCDDGNIDPGDCCSPTCQYESTTTVCRAAAGVCDAPDTCDGAGACTPDAKLTSECRAMTSACDAAEFCDGLGDDCPPDLVLPDGTVCRPAAQICDAVEYCDGVSKNCPITLPANGLPCPDGDLCNGDEFCVGWVCTYGEPLVCDDDWACTADSCDPELGCVYEQIQGPGCVDTWLPSASPTGRLLLGLLLVTAGATFLARRGRRGA
jgi:cysteine-rich repeat protein